MDIEFQDKGDGFYAVSVTTHPWYLMFTKRVQEFIYANNGRGGDALIDTHTGKHVFGSLREAIKGRFNLWRLEKIGLIN